MKKINKIKHLFSVIAVSILLVATSCETTDLDVNIDPNQLSPGSADPTFVLNSIQAGTIGVGFGLNVNVRDIMRHVNMFGTYATNSQATALNGAWANAYSVKANRQLIEELNQNADLANHLGAAQVLEAIAFVNLVDFIGTAAYSESNDPSVANPKLDDGRDIYEAMFALIDEGIQNLQVGGQIKFEDLFFDGDLTKWVRMANTLKLRMYVQAKLANLPNAAANINSIVSSGNYIAANSQDFQANFGTQNDNPDVRHPDFVSTYEAAGAGGIYMSNEFLNVLLNDKTIEDPRLKHYIYRQSLTDPVNTGGNVILPCQGNPVYTLCYVGNFYWGRMHGDDEGIPNDNNLRSTFGAYPAGGAFDTGSGNVPTNSSINAGGAGIFPVMTAAFTDFLLAEAALPAPAGLGINGNAATYLENGMRKSFAKVSSVTGVAMSTADVNTYVNEVLANFNNAATNDDKLAVIMKEFYIATWGNSVEIYNGYRRTGYPDLGGSVIPNTDFPRNFLVPLSEIQTNDLLTTQPLTRTTQVFWDTNPAGFVQ